MVIKQAAGGYRSTRRQFLKQAGMNAGYLMAASLGLSAGCNGASPTTSSTPGASPTTPLTQSQTPTTSPTGVLPTTTTTAVTSTPPATSGMALSLDPMPLLSKVPQMLEVPGCTTKVAADRLYSVENLWLKQMDSEHVVLGLTDRLQALISNVVSISLKPLGEAFGQDELFGYIEGYKMNVDLISPITGVVVRNNPALVGFSDIVAGPINVDPYGMGWVVVIKLLNPGEIKGLLTPEQYVDLTKK